MSQVQRPTQPRSGAEQLLSILIFLVVLAAQALVALFSVFSVMTASMCANIPEDPPLCGPNGTPLWLGGIAVLWLGMGVITIVTIVKLLSGNRGRIWYWPLIQAAVTVILAGAFYGWLAFLLG